MKPYSFRGDGSDNTGCCPGHDWPPTRRWSSMYSSCNSKKKQAIWNAKAKRQRRRKDKENLKKDEDA